MVPLEKWSRCLCNKCSLVCNERSNARSYAKGKRIDACARLRWFGDWCKSIDGQSRKCRLSSSKARCQVQPHSDWWVSGYQSTAMADFARLAGGLWTWWLSSKCLYCGRSQAVDLSLPSRWPKAIYKCQAVLRINHASSVLREEHDSQKCWCH